MRNFREDKITKRNLNQMLNPELNILEPGGKTKPRSGLMAEKVSVPDADTVREGLLEMTMFLKKVLVKRILIISLLQ